MEDLHDILDDLKTRRNNTTGLELGRLLNLIGFDKTEGSSHTLWRGFNKRITLSRPETKTLKGVYPAQVAAILRDLVDQHGEALLVKRQLRSVN